MKLFLFRLILLTMSFSLYAQSWMPISKTCDETGNYIFKSRTGSNIEEVEKLDDSAAMKWTNLRMGGQWYDSFIIFNSPSAFLADKITRINLRALVNQNCKIYTAEMSLPDLVLVAKQCLPAFFETLPQDNDNYGSHWQLLAGANPKPVSYTHLTLPTNREV